MSNNNTYLPLTVEETSEEILKPKRKKVFRVVKRLRTLGPAKEGERLIGFANGRKVIVKRPKDVADNVLRAAVITTKYDEYQKKNKASKLGAASTVVPVKRKRIFRTQPITLPPNFVVGAPQYAPAAPKLQYSIENTL